MSRIASIAKSKITPAGDNYKLLYAAGKTGDIIQAILDADDRFSDNTKSFAPYLLADTLLETCKNIWNYEKENIRYQLDPRGVQLVKSPAQTSKDGFADCKSLSVFTGSILKNLGIPYAYRFASYSSRPEYTHVYVVVQDNTGKEIIIDSTLPRFNKEAEYNFKKDYPMSSKVYQVSGVPNHEKWRLPKEPHELTEADMDAAIARQKLIEERNIVANIRGVGSLKVEQYNDAISVLTEVQEILNDDSLDPDEKELHIHLLIDQSENGDYSIAHRIKHKSLADRADHRADHARTMRSRR